MKKTLLSLSAIVAAVVSVHAQQVEDQVTMGAGYANNVFYNLETKNDQTFPNNGWDLAFYRKSAYGFAVRTNDAKGAELYEASANIADWASIDIANLDNWTRLYNSDTTWMEGGFENGSGQYGWGSYDTTTHEVIGTVIFVLKTDSQYTKIKIDKFANGYTFTYAKWDGTAWGADVTEVIPNSENSDKVFNYYNLTSEETVQAEPAEAEWDLVFTKYITPITANDGTVVMYPVTGVLHAPGVKVAQTTESIANSDDLSEEINTIGSDWKTFGGSGYTVSSDINYFIKRNNSDVVYKINFTEFAGSSTGVIKFNIDNNATLSIEEVAKGVAFDIYPNPSTDKQINVVYDITTNASAKNTITIYSLAGAKVFTTEANSHAGFYDQKLDLSRLAGGMYILEFKSGDKSQTKKIILK